MKEHSFRFLLSRDISETFLQFKFSKKETNNWRNFPVDSLANSEHLNFDKLLKSGFLKTRKNAPLQMISTSSPLF